MQVSEAVQTSSSDGKQQPHCYYFGPKLLTRRIQSVTKRIDSYCSHFIAILLIISIVPKPSPTYLPTYLSDSPPSLLITKYRDTHQTNLIPRIPPYHSYDTYPPPPSPPTPELSLTNPPVPNRDPANRYISPSKPQSDTNSAMLFPPHRARQQEENSIHTPTINQPNPITSACILLTSTKPSTTPTAPTPTSKSQTTKQHHERRLLLPYLAGNSV
ncbi:uncharacterized protein RSE6_01274 [Rhynchosporium secalis]|uniref:Uncharacterized protein n=1 Tax=Rhynchosporium secalis TaxID=38038 RepID=A0A1E1LXC6_RHYSE|nr:uncharacterized protein RSE6_01274 [Rhynchosporium secalis]